MKLAVIGTGYVGLVSGTCFSELGYDVTCVDLDAKKIETLRAGHVPIYEPGLDLLIERNVSSGRLSFTTDLQDAVGQADAVFIAVGTPTRPDNGQADLTYIMRAAADIAPAMQGYTVVVVKSTVPIGVNRKIRDVLHNTYPAADFDIASNPEFLREGTAIKDFMMPDRVVVGVESERAGELMAEIYRPLTERDFPLLLTNLETAEMIKYASNAFLATKITFINEIAALCEKLGSDVAVVSKGMGMDKRIGGRFLNPGPGYGGSCFPKDTQALVKIGQESAVQQHIVEAVVRVNEQVKARMIKNIKDMCGGSFREKKIAVFGVTFKPDTDDMREAPSLTIVPALIGGGAVVNVVDPLGQREGEHLLPGVCWYDDPYLAVDGCHLVVILTEWSDFVGLDLKALAAVMEAPRMADMRNVYEAKDVENAGFELYYGVGRGRVPV